MTSKMLFSGNSNPALAQKIAKQLNIPLGKTNISAFSDGEIRIEILDEVRDKRVFILQSTSSPPNHNIMELLLLTDAIRRNMANHITAIIPYFGYARQDKSNGGKKSPISAKVIADLLATVRVERVLTVDLHSEQLQGFFSMPVDNIYPGKLFLEDILQKGYVNPLIVSPDVGGVVRARKFAQLFNNAELAIIDKRRPEPNVSEVVNIIGEVKDRFCVIIDDLIDTAGTICHAAEALKEKGAKKVLAYCTHPVLSGNAVSSIQTSVLDELVVTDSIPLKEEAKSCQRIRQLSLDRLLAEELNLIFGR